MSKEAYEKLKVLYSNSKYDEITKYLLELNKYLEGFDVKNIKKQVNDFIYNLDISVEDIHKDKYVKKYNKILYNKACIKEDDLLKLLKDGQHVSIKDTKYKSKYDYILHKISVILLKIKVAKKNNIRDFLTYGDIAVILYFIYNPFVKLKSYLGKIYRKRLFIVPEYENYMKDAKLFRDNIKKIADAFLDISQEKNEFLQNVKDS
jgi:hypothetical protein